MLAFRFREVTYYLIKKLSHKLHAIFTKIVGSLRTLFASNNIFSSARRTGKADTGESLGQTGRNSPARAGRCSSKCRTAVANSVAAPLQYVYLLCRPWLTVARANFGPRSGSAVHL